MVCIRFTSLLLGLLLSLLALGDSIAIAHHVIGEVSNRDHTIEGNKELRVEAGTTAATRSKWLRGRKMGVEDVVKKEMKGRMNTGANSSVGKCENGRNGELNLECELRDSRSLPSSTVIPFSSDYHAPKTHPPKNN